MKTKPVLIGFFCVVVLIGATSVYLALTIDRAEKSVVSLAAPDGKYKAVRVTFSNGGAAPFCFDTISVFLSVYPDSFAESDKSYEIYGAPCAASDRRAALPKMEWLTDKALRITNAPGPGNPPRLKDHDASHFVGVTFVKAK
ncbi:MAG TPA: hypothetical protein VIJ78_13150 [Pseudolabrys sp.]|nr:hypothetical protein [Pseudolabrys sp.]